MDIRVSLILLAFLMHYNLGVPVQFYSSEQIKNVNTPPPPEEKDVFTIITEANKGSSKMLHYGDIAQPLGRNAMKCDGGSCRWTKNSSGIVNVPYNISSAYSANEMSIILGAMQDFATLTCVRFIPRTLEPDYLNIMPDSGCWSYLGRIRGPQALSLQNCIGKGSVQHELNHALGFFHEQSRSDRDNYVDIMTDNIVPSALGNFNLQDTDNLGVEYDYTSVMHYSMWAFSNNGQPTIVPKPDPSMKIGQRYGLSNLDISKINKLYNCDSCSTILPDSTGTLMSANYPSKYPNNSNCVWLIRAPSDKVFLEFSAFIIQYSPGCVSDYLTVYDGATKSSPVLINRGCGTGQPPSLVASTNVILVEFVSDANFSAVGFKASYSTVQCGSTLTNSSGVFSSPNYPSSYPSSVNCSWVISAPLGYEIALNITDFDVELQSNCTKDYLLIIDGPKSTFPKIGKYCGSVTIPNIVSSRNTIIVQFHSDQSTQSRGFQATYFFVPNK